MGRTTSRRLDHQNITDPVSWLSLAKHYIKPNAIEVVSTNLAMYILALRCIGSCLCRMSVCHSPVRRDSTSRIVGRAGYVIPGPSEPKLTVNSYVAP